MPLGDSITRGKGGSSWRPRFRDRMRQNGFAMTYVGACPHAPNPHLNRTDLLLDGTHPNIAGDRKIATLWFTAVSCALQL